MRGRGRSEGGKQESKESKKPETEKENEKNPKLKMHTVHTFSPVSKILIFTIDFSFICFEKIENAYKTHVFISR